MARNIIMDTAAPFMVQLGFAGENEVQSVTFDYSKWVNLYGDGTLSLLLQRHGDTNPYLVALTDSTWTISDTDTAIAGFGLAQLVYTVDGAIKKSSVFKIYVDRSLTSSVDPPDPYDTWLDQVIAVGAEVDADADRAEAAVSHYPKVVDGNWYVWDGSEWVDTGYSATGPQGETGSQGPAGIGVPEGGASGQVLAKASGSDYDTEWVDQSGGGTSDYADLTNKPSINSITLSGNKTASDLGLATASDLSDLGDDVSDLRQDLKLKAPVIVSSASGAIASFTDGIGGEPLSSCVVQIDPVQDLHGYDLPWVAGGGANKWDEQWEVGMLTWTGADATGTNRIRSKGYIPVVEGETYRVVTSNNLQFFYYDSSKAFVSYESSSKANGTTITIPTGCSYLRFYTYGTTYGETYKNDIAINYPSSVTTYSPYSNICPISGWTGCEVKHSGADVSDPTTIPVTFPISAGTVYGGYADLVNGKLVVNRAMVDMGTLNWAINGRRFLVQLTGAKGSVTDSSVANIVCSCYKAVTNNQTYGGTAVGISLNKDDDAYCGIYDPTYEDLSTFKSAISNQTLVYELVTPITYDIDPVTLTLLHGDNNIWADTGAVAVTYPADTQTYVDESVPAIPVQDVQINGTSIVSDGVAEIPVASGNNSGVVKVAGYGLAMSNGVIVTTGAPLADIKTGTTNNALISPFHQHQATFYGLAKAAGDTTQSTSSNAVGTYTDDALVKIQKMLGIYEAPWELIRTDTFTNAEQADHIITVDGNGNAFELTDVRMLFWLPQQDTASAKGDYGRIFLYYDNSNSDSVYCGAWTQAASAAAKICGLEAIQKDNMVTLSMWKNAALSAEATLYNTLRKYPFSNNNSQIWSLLSSQRVYNKIVISSVLGTGAYVLYGKRKWN